MIRFSAVVLAGGSGRRMGGNVKKQYMEIGGKPVIYYPLSTFEKSGVDEVILVVTPGDEDYVKNEIVDRFGFKKVTQIVAGGAERYDSVQNGIEKAGGEFVLIHDGARAFVTCEIINRTMEALINYGACVVGMPSKDTVKVSDENGFVNSTPLREHVWTIQTPQAFYRDEFMAAYEKLSAIPGGYDGITDDAMIMERAAGYIKQDDADEKKNDSVKKTGKTDSDKIVGKNGGAVSGRKIKLVEGSYDNIKITTPEDILIAEELVKKYGVDPG